MMKSTFRTAIVLASAALAAEHAFAQVVEPVPISALGRVGIPNVNRLGILDGSGSSAWGVVTNAGRQTDLEALGKALFWDMQVGGDGVQSCASCHFHAGADIRKSHQMSPGPAHWSDNAFDLIAANKTLTLNEFSPAGGPNRGLPVSEAALMSAGSTPDAANGDPGRVIKAPANLDVNDVAGSQGVRAATFAGVNISGPNRGLDYATLASADDRGFGLDFTANAPGVPDTTRATTARNAPSVVNAIYNLRNFWDGRADAFFNGRNPLGFLSPDARVKVASANNTIADLKLRIPFSSLASQAVGPIGNATEMTLGSRHVSELGKKLLRGAAIPLYGQEVKCNDSLLAGFVSGCAAPTDGVRGLNSSYAKFVENIFRPEFWNSSQCLDQNGSPATCGTVGAYTLMEYNFPLFFGLAIQAYEATLTTEQTITDLVVGGVATGTVTNVSKTATKTVNVANLSLPNCVLQAQFSGTAVDVNAATQLCTYHYATYIHPKAFTGAEALQATGNVTPGTPIGGCTKGATNTTLSATGLITSSGAVGCNTATAAQAAARSSLIAIDRGVARFFAGATACGACHANSEFTLASVSALTGFGAAPLPPLPAGQLRKNPPEAATERMIQFDGQTVVYDTGFYNIGVRPTAEDVAQGKALQIDKDNSIPLAYSKLLDILNGGTTVDVGGSKVTPQMRSTLSAEVGALTIPTAPGNLAPRQFPLRVACAPELTGQKNNKCVTTVVANERLSRFGGFKTPGLRNVKFTGPYFHNGSKLNLRQVFEHYKTAGAFTTLNRANLAGGIKVFSLNAGDEAAVVEMMETGLTDWRLAWQEGKFDHPEICIPNGHDPVTGRTILAGIEAVGSGGGKRLATFEEVVRGIDGNLASVNGPCNVPGIAELVNGKSLSTIDVPLPTAVVD